MNLKIITILVLLCAILSVGCTEDKYTEEQEEAIRENFASEMVVLIYDMPTEPSLSALIYKKISNPTVEDCNDWILKAKDHLKEANKYSDIVFVDSGNKHDEKKHTEYVEQLEEYISEVDSYKGKAEAYEDISIMIDKSAEMGTDIDYLIYEHGEGEITSEEFFTEVHQLSVEQRDIWINIRHVLIENENEYFDKTKETLEFIEHCDDMITILEGTIDLVSE